MKKLILVRHSNPVMEKEVSSHTWILSDKGKANCKPLAEKLRPYGVDIVITSNEPKTRETGWLVAEILDVPVKAVDGLEEQMRHTVGWFDSVEARNSAVRKLFEVQDEVVFGEESAVDAYERFARAINLLENDYPDKVVTVVTHGTVMALFLERHSDVDPIEFWQKMGLPMYVVLDSDYAVEAIVTDVTQ